MMRKGRRAKGWPSPPARGGSQSLEELNTLSADWSNRSGAQRFFLFSLKALAFIRLRQGDSKESERILAKLSELDRAIRSGHRCSASWRARAY